MRLPVAVLLACSLAAGPAFAQPSETPPAYAPLQPAPPATHVETYGGTIAVVDGLSFGALLAGATIFVMEIDRDDVDDSSVGFGAALMIAGAGGYLFGGPLVHNSKGNTSGAWKSFAGRLVLPLLGSAIGSAAEDSEVGGSLSSLGVLSAMVLDWFVFARHEVRDEPRWVPYAAHTREQSVVGLGLRF